MRYSTVQQRSYVLFCGTDREVWWMVNKMLHSKDFSRLTAYVERVNAG